MSHSTSDNRKQEYFPPERLELHIELRQHPDLLELLARHPLDEFEIRIAQIATYCEVILEGDYTPQDLTDLCVVLKRRLVEKRTGIVFPDATEVAEVGKIVFDSTKGRGH